MEKLQPPTSKATDLESSPSSRHQIFPSEGEAGLAAAELCRKHAISAATYYACKSKYAGASVSDLTRMRELEVKLIC